MAWIIDRSELLKALEREARECEARECEAREREAREREARVRDFREAFIEVFKRRWVYGPNRIRLVQLRRELSEFSKEEFDSGLTQLRIENGLTKKTSLQIEFDDELILIDEHGEKFLSCKL